MVRKTIVLATAAALVGAACAPAEPEPPPFAERVVLSLLAVGDTGRNNHRLRWLDRQVATGVGMAAEHAARPVDAVVFLGDNFYYDGLVAGELERQIRRNLVRPYCAFVDLGGLLSPRVREACPPADHRVPVPLYAVLGNHDYNAPESPTLEREVLPWYVANWTVAEDDFAVVELGQGVSLVLVESMPYLEEGGVDAFARALRRARGPWRVVASHHPLADPTEAAHRLLEGVRRAGVRVQLFLHGERHNLQVLPPPADLGGLHVVAGGGADTRRLEAKERLFGLESQGFARVDLVEADDGQPASGPRLVVSVYSTPTWTFEYDLGRGRRLVARWSVDLEGRTRDEGVGRRP